MKGWRRTPSLIIRSRRISPPSFTRQKRKGMKSDPSLSDFDGLYIPAQGGLQRALAPIPASSSAISSVQRSLPSFSAVPQSSGRWGKFKIRSHFQL